MDNNISIGPEAVTLIGYGREKTAELAAGSGNGSGDAHLREGLQSVADALSSIRIDTPRHQQSAGPRASKRPTIRPRGYDADLAPES